MTDIKDLIEARTATDPRLKAVLKKIKAGTATFKDTAYYSEIYSNITGSVFGANVLDLEGIEREEVCMELLRGNYEEINNICAQVQTALDEAAGIHIKPQRAAFPTDRVDQIAHSILDPTVKDSVIKRRANTGVANVSQGFHDSYIKVNASFRNDAGLKVYINRETDGKCCEWCTKIAGRYSYGTEPDDIYRRHDNCGCTVTYENGKQRQDVWSKRSWTAPEVGAGAPPPTRFTPEQAAEIQARNMPQGLTNRRRNGIIDTRGYIDDNFDRKISLTSAEEDLKAVNPNYRKVKGYDGNCQRCVPTYVLRRRGFDVEALPVGENTEIDNLLRFNPHVIWKKAESPVIPKATRGSKFFGKPEIEKYMEDLPEGAMCEIRCEWKDNNYGHVFIAEKRNKKVQYIDPQTGNTDVSHYFDKMVEDTTTYWRIDNANLDDDLIRYCCKNKG